MDASSPLSYQRVEPPQRRISGLALAKLAVAGFYTFCLALTVVGYQAILPVLLSEEAYAYLCDGGTITPAPDGQLCLSQKLHLDLMFTLATSTLNIVGLLVGIVMVRCGPGWSCRIGCLIIAVGSLIFALSTNDVPLWTVGYVLMGAGGPFVAFSVFSLAGLAPALSTIIIAILVGVFDASASVMLIAKLLSVHAGASLRQIFTWYISIPISLVFVSFWLFPSAASAPDVDEKGQPRVSIDSGIVGQGRRESITHDESQSGSSGGQGGVRQSIDGGQTPRAWFQGRAELSIIIRSNEFWLVAMWSAALISSNYFYIQNVSDQLSWVAPADSQDLIAPAINFFSVVLPAAGLATPVTGLILERFGVRSAVALNGVLCAVLAVLADLRGVAFALQYATLVIVCFNRFLYFSTAPVLLAALFGEIGPSAIYPVVFAVSGVVNLLGFLWTYLSKHSLGGNFLPLNIVLNAVCVVLTVSLWLRIAAWCQATPVLEAPSHAYYSTQDDAAGMQHTLLADD